ncbi:site-specific integrase [Mycobacterium kansasii]|uniref:tyrosine-type recombinase/integrase n=1 Tax=Mycobacterium kansasii TaxID=1768 RepID=UPI000CDD6674|nr:site-specific integrase [Mycobacterium kansasii]POX92237.1 site-specific integrase [Mycobacterium kansasii]POX97974.1 site-specific integrase [Mycobacterium kansasii]POY24451.1 site-specific integrase [Mycobacterium kansasii]
MAFIRTRTRKDGSPYYSVTYRIGGRGGRQSSTSFADAKQAARFCKLVDSLGPERAMEVAGIADTQRSLSTLTVGEWLDRHIGSLSGVERKTISEYKRYATRDIGPVLGAVPLGKLTRDDVADWVNTMFEAGAAGGTIENKHGFLSGALKRAVEDGYLAANPCQGLRLPRTEQREMVFLTREEFQILKAAFSPHYQPLVEFLVASGCRAGEAFALRPSDVDRAAGTVRIARSWKRAGSGYELGPPKTKKSVRTINVPKSVLAQLDYSGEWLFTGTNGQPVRIYSWRANVWYKSLAKAQAKDEKNPDKPVLEKSPRIHDLRHTCASWMIQNGVPLPVIQAHLGHESIKTTVDRYGHLDRSNHVAAADAIGKMLR